MTGAAFTIPFATKGCPMRISREVEDPRLGRFLQEADEETLRELMEEREADQELAAAIQHGIDVDGYESRPVGEFLDELKAAGKL